VFLSPGSRAHFPVPYGVFGRRHDRTFSGVMPVINVTDPAFGALGNGIADDTAAIQSAITAATARHGAVYLPAGTYSVSRINLTGLGQLVFFGDGWNKTTLSPRAGTASYGTSNGHVIDLTGSLNCTLRDFQIAAFNSVPTPTTGIFQANIASGVSNANILSNIYVSGPYSVAAYYNFSVPSSQIYSCKFYNYSTGAGQRYVGIFTNNNATFNLTSAYQTVNAAGQAPSDISIFGTEWHFFPGAGANAQVVWVDNGGSIRFYGGNITGGGQAYVLITNTCSNLLFSGVTFETESEPVTPTTVFSLSASAVLNGLTFNQCSYIVVTPSTGLMTIAAGGAFNSAGDGQVLAFTSAGALSAGNTYFVGPADNDTVSSSNVSVTMTERGLILNMWANTSASPGQTPGYTITVLVNGSATALTGVISGGNTQVKDQTHAVQVNQGDTVCFKVVTAAATNSTRLSGAVTFLPTG
jgi:hypothetical protein